MDKELENLESLPDFNKLFSDLSKEKENMSEDLEIFSKSFLLDGGLIQLYFSFDIVHIISNMFNNEELNKCIIDVHYTLMLLTTYCTMVERHPSIFAPTSSFYLQSIDVLIGRIQQLTDILYDTAEGITVDGNVLFGNKTDIYLPMDSVCTPFSAVIDSLNKSKKMVQEYFENRKAC